MGRGVVSSLCTESFVLLRHKNQFVIIEKRKAMLGHNSFDSLFKAAQVNQFVIIEKRKAMLGHNSFDSLFKAAQVK